MDDIKFSIVGVGRFGSFWGRHLSRFFPVHFYDVDPERRGAVSPYGTWSSLEECLGKDFVFLTIPIRQIADFLQRHAGKFRPGTVVIDCASVKLVVLKWFAEYLPEDIYYAASHPLFGPDSAAQGLKGHTITLQPGRLPFHKYQRLVNAFEEKMQLQVLNIPAGEHDRLMAYNLSLIHHLGRTFHHMQISKLSLVMANLEKMNHISRVAANDTKELFQDFYRYNPYAEIVRDQFLDNFQMINAKAHQPLKNWDR